jgi:hypothetical protein
MIVVVHCHRKFVSSLTPQRCVNGLTAYVRVFEHFYINSTNPLPHLPLDLLQVGEERMCL